MRRASLAALVVVALSGCSVMFATAPDDVKPGTPPVCSGDNLAQLDTAIATFTSLVGAWFAIQIPGACSSCFIGRDYYERVALFGAAYSALFGASAVYGYHLANRCAREKRAFAESVQAAADARVRQQRDAEQRTLARAARRERAIELAKKAATTARADDCATVTSVDAELRDVDVEYHDVVFARDVAIARCLAAP